MILDFRTPAKFFEFLLSKPLTFIVNIFTISMAIDVREWNIILHETLKKTRELPEIRQNPNRLPKTKFPIEVFFFS